MTELGPHSMRKRTLKSGRRKKERVSKANPKCMLPIVSTSVEVADGGVLQCTMETVLGSTTSNVSS